MKIAKSFSPGPKSGPLHPNYNHNSPDFVKYKKLVSYYTEKNYKNNKDKINPYNYQRTLCGVDNGYQLDHIVSIKNGFDSGTLPIIIGGVENLQMLTWQENNQKRWH